jgi:hypothetical protein
VRQTWERIASFRATFFTSFVRTMWRNVLRVSLYAKCDGLRLAIMYVRDRFLCAGERHRRGNGWAESVFRVGGSGLGCGGLRFVTRCSWILESKKQNTTRCLLSEDQEHVRG